MEKAVAMIRAFVALDLPAATQHALASLQKEWEQLKAPVAWIKPDKVHLTLKFLGNITPEQVAGIQSSLGDIASRTAPFRLQPTACGAFPSIKQMRVIWVGLSGDLDALHTLQQNIEKGLIALNFPAEERSFRGHLTLGRVKGRGHLYQLQEALLRQQGFHAEAFDVREIVLYRSELRPEGARYTSLFRAGLGGPAQ
jgi:RNA 2',3'-cyclic 3'-phosphodiesterase